MFNTLTQKNPEEIKTEENVNQIQQCVKDSIMWNIATFNSTYIQIEIDPPFNLTITGVLGSKIFSIKYSSHKAYILCDRLLPYMGSRVPYTYNEKRP